MSTISYSELLSLLGTIGTFLLALAAFWNIFKPLKPRLNLSYGTVGGYLSTLEENGIPPGELLSYSFNYYIYRLKIENNNKFYSKTAKNVFCSFIEIEKWLDGKWCSLEPFNPFRMKWTSKPKESDIFSNDLAKGEYQYVNFFTVTVIAQTNYMVVNKEYPKIQMIPGHIGIEKISLAAGFPKNQLFKEGKFRFKIGLHGENVKSKTYTYEVEFNPVVDESPDKMIKIGKVND